MTDSQLSVPCRYCGRPSKPHGEHHHRPEWGPVGKGMGGTHDHLETLHVCPDHHDQLHMQRLQAVVAGDFVSFWRKGHVVAERALVDNDSAQDTRYWTDEALALGWSQAHERAIPLLAFQCQIAHEFQRRYSWLDEWAEGSAQIIGRLTARVIHPRDVYRKAALYATFADRWGDYDFLGARVSISVAESASPEEALEFATLQIGEGNHKLTEIAQQVHEKFGKQRARGEICECPACGARHRKKGA